MESLAQATKESEEKDRRMTRELEHLMNDPDTTYAQTMSTLESRLDAKADLMMPKLDELSSSNNRENQSNPRDNSRRPIDGLRASRHTEASRDREQVLILTKGRDAVQLHRGQVGRIQSR